MHTLLDLSGMFVVILLASGLVLRLMQHFDDWSQRRVLQLLVLSMPLMSLIVVLGGLGHVMNRSCLLNVPAWDHRLDVTLLLLMGFFLLGSLGLGVGRFVLLQGVMMHQESIDDPELQRFALGIAHQHGRIRLHVRLVRSVRPLALLYGIRHPTLLLSTWMIEHLDQQEMEAVIVHELVHLSHSDYLVNWVAMLLRDAFFYLPTSRTVYRQWHCEKELACDDLAAQATQGPLALASALTKVWLHLVDSPPVTLVQSLAGGGKSMISRIDRLLSKREPTRRRQGLRFSLGLSASIGVLLLVMMVGLALMRVELFCWPIVVP